MGEGALASRWLPAMAASGGGGRLPGASLTLTLDVNRGFSDPL